MHDWVRSLSVLGGAFGGVVVITLGLAGLLVPERTISSVPAASGPAGAAGPGAAPVPVAGIPGLGGTITVSGDREGSFALTRGVQLSTYALEGGAGRITFESTPVQVSQVSYDGLEFFPEPGQCSITAGNLENAMGIGFAELRCDDLVDVRGSGTVSLRGEIGLPLDLLTVRTLPPSGGSLAVGDETWTFEEAILIQHGGPPRSLGFSYDIEARLLELAHVTVGDQDHSIPEGTCTFDRTELGRHNPQTIVIELTVDCASVDVPGMGFVPITGVVVVDELQWPE